MTWTNTRRLSAKRVAGIALAAVCTLGAFAGTADAQQRWREHRYERHNWNGGYYRSPPVVYGSPYYYPPPVVYGQPGFGLNFNFR